MIFVVLNLDATCFAFLSPPLFTPSMIATPNDRILLCDQISIRGYRSFLYPYLFWGNEDPMSPRSVGTIQQNCNTRGRGGMGADERSGLSLHRRVCPFIHEGNINVYPVNVMSWEPSARGIGMGER